MDLRYAFRSLRKSPGFTLTAVMVLALGIGINTSIFSVVDALLLRPLPYPEANRLVTLASLSKTRGRTYAVSAPDYRDWRAQSTSFDGVAYYSSGETSVVAGQKASYARVTSVSEDFFPIFTARPFVGRLFAREELVDNGPQVALISYGFWQRYFGGDTKVLEQDVKFQGVPHRIIGVLPPDFAYPLDSEIWYPAMQSEETKSRTAHNYEVVARLKPNVPLEQAKAEMKGIAARLEQLYPENKNKSAAVTPLQEEMVEGLRSTLYLLLAAVAAVLLISCANVANLLLARATARTRELAIRAAIGAARGRLIRQMVTESLVLAIAAAVVGLLLAFWGVEALLALAPAQLPRAAEIHLNGRVLLFTLVLSCASCLIFGLVPALQASRVDLNEALKKGGGRQTSDGSGRMRQLLVVAEVAFSVVLLIGAGLLVKSLYALSHVEMGFGTERRLVVQTTVPADDLASARRANAFYERLLPELRSMPGVQAAAAVFGLPTSKRHSNGGYTVMGRPEPRPGEWPQAVFSVASNDYFRTMGIPMRRGRDIQPGDQYDAPFVVVVNEAFVRQTFPNEDPIGQQIQCGLDSEKPMTIVGVVGDVRQYNAAQAPQAEMYMPYLQHPYYGTAMHVVIQSDQLDLLPNVVRAKVTELNREVPMRMSTIETTLSDSIALPRFRTLLLTLFAALAVGLAMVGVYGVMSYLVGRRVSEIGLRIALGAQTRDVLQMVVGEGLRLVGVGLVVGLVAAVAASRLLAGMLYGVKAADAMTYGAVVILLLATALLASYIPARRASRVDPLIALRQE